MSGYYSLNDGASVGIKNVRLIGILKYRYI